MAKKTQDLKPDTVLKNYWSGNEQFADLFNAVLYEGKQVIRPEELEDVDTEESSVLENKDYAESIRASRDNIKVSKRSIHRIWGGACDAGNGITGAYPLCNACADHGI